MNPITPPPSPQFSCLRAELLQRQRRDYEALMARHVAERRQLYDDFRAPAETLEEAIARLSLSTQHE